MPAFADPDTLVEGMRKHLYLILPHVADEDNVFVSDDLMYGTKRPTHHWFVIQPPDEFTFDEASFIGGGDLNTEAIGLVNIATHLATTPMLDGPDESLIAQTKEQDNINWYTKQLLRAFGGHHLLEGTFDGPPLTTEHMRPVVTRRLFKDRVKIVQQLTFEVRFAWDVGE